jgi:hypothetical protein
MLDTGLRRAYTPEAYGQECAGLSAHVYGRCPELHAGARA